MELTIQIMLLGQSNLIYSTGPLLRVPNAITIMLTNIILSYGSTPRTSIAFWRLRTVCVIGKAVIKF